MAQDKNGIKLPHNDIAKYGNEINRLNFTGFGKMELNHFWAYISQLSNLDRKDLKKYNFDVTKAKFTFSELRKLTGYKNRNNNQYYEFLKKLGYKLQSIPLVSETENKNGKRTEIMSVFTKTIVDQKGSAAESTVTVQTSPEILPYLRDLKEQMYTAYNLERFMNLKSIYAKNLFRLLSQFRTTGYYTVYRDAFMELIGTPKSYFKSNNFKRFQTQILDPAVEELQSSFKNLKYEKITKKVKRGRPRIYKLEFTFEKQTPQELGLNDSTRKDVTPKSEENSNSKLNDATNASSKVKKNKEAYLSHTKSKSDITETSSDTEDFINKLL